MSQSNEPPNGLEDQGNTLPHEGQEETRPQPALGPQDPYSGHSQLGGQGVGYVPYPGELPFQGRKSSRGQAHYGQAQHGQYPGQDTGNPKLIDYIGLDSGLTTPATFLDNYLHTVTAGLSNVHFTTVHAGSSGGTAECVDSFSSVVGAWTECGWATSTTIGTLQTPSRNANTSQLAAIMRRMRSDLERS